MDMRIYKYKRKDIYIYIYIYIYIHYHIVSYIDNYLSIVYPIFRDLNLSEGSYVCIYGYIDVWIFIYMDRGSRI